MDLTEELPIWPLSCFCPGVKAPVQLFGGEQRERSFEEMRLNHYELCAQGQEALAAQQQDELGQKAVEQNEAAKKDPEAAVAYILQGENEHPNRIDIEDMYNRGEIDPSQPLPAAVVEIIHGALPSTVIPQAPVQPTPQPQPQQQINAFARPVSQPAPTQNPFGTPAPPPFGNPNPFNQSNGMNPLAQPQFATPQPQQSPFQQAPNQFGQAPFGQIQQQNQNPLATQNPMSPFGQPQRPSPFGGIQQQASQFGQPQQMATAPVSFNNFDQGQVQ